MVSLFKYLSVKIHQYIWPRLKKVVIKLAAIVKVISLKCVQHKIKPNNVVTKKIK